VRRYVLHSASMLAPFLLVSFVVEALDVKKPSPGPNRGEGLAAPVSVGLLLVDELLSLCT
jgi:hypothetical protein